MLICSRICQRRELNIFEQAHGWVSRVVKEKHTVDQQAALFEDHMWVIAVDPHRVGSNVCFGAAAVACIS